MPSLDLFIAGASLFLGFFTGVVVSYSFRAHEIKIITLARLGLVLVVIFAGTAYYRDLSCQREYNITIAQSIAIGRQAQIDLIESQKEILKKGVTDPAEQKRYTETADKLLEVYERYPIPSNVCST